MLITGSAAFRGEAEGDREHDASTGKDRNRIRTIGRGHHQVGVERIRVGCAVGGDSVRRDLGGDAVTGNVVFVEDVVEAEAEFRVVEEGVAADGVVEEQVSEGERRDRRLIVVGTVVQALGSNGLVEDARVPAAVLIGKTFRQDIGGGIRHPQTAGGGYVERRRCRGTSSRRRVAIGDRSARVLSVVVAGVQVETETMSERDVAFGLNTLGERRGSGVVDRFTGVERGE